MRRQSPAGVSHRYGVSKMTALQMAKPTRETEASSEIDAEKSEDPEKTPLKFVIELTTDGERRAHVMAHVHETFPEGYTIKPFYFREICGPNVDWTIPQPGEAIATLAPITSFTEAHNMLMWWACRTMATNARPR